MPRCAPNEIGYGKLGSGQMKQCSNILQFPHVRAVMLDHSKNFVTF